MVNKNNNIHMQCKKNAELNTENLLCYKEAGIRRIICNNRDRRFHLNIKRSTLYHRHSGNWGLYHISFLLLWEIDPKK